jgi:hypothetical protein
MMNYVDALQLSGYPQWVKYSMWFSGLAWTVAYAILFALKPDPMLSVDSVRLALLPATGRSAIEFQLRNTIKTPANIVAARFAIGQKPTGGLMSTTTTPSLYLVMRAEDGKTLLSQLEGARLAHNVQINQPFVGVEYWEFEIPLSESVEEQKTTNFAIGFDAALNDILSKRPLQVTLRYNGKVETPAQFVR